MSSDIKEKLAFKVIQFIGPEAKLLHSSSQCTVKLLTIKTQFVHKVQLNVMQQMQKITKLTSDRD